jgi:hypothetical protein
MASVIAIAGIGMSPSDATASVFATGNPRGLTFGRIAPCLSRYVSSPTWPQERGDNATASRLHWRPLMQTPVGNSGCLHLEPRPPVLALGGGCLEALSLGWWLLSRYGRIKYRYLLPIYRLLKPAPQVTAPSQSCEECGTSPSRKRSGTKAANSVRSAQFLVV